MLRAKFIALSLGATCAAAGGVLAVTGVLPRLLLDKTAPQQIDHAAPQLQKLATIPVAPLSKPASNPKPIVPQFDTVRVEPSGDTVVAGHGEPNAKVTLFAGQKNLGETDADDGGDFVIVPQPLDPGTHVLMLSSTSAGKSAVLSQQSITVSVPPKGQKDVIVALVQPGKPSQLLTDPTQNADGAKQAVQPVQQQTSDKAASSQTKPIVSAQVADNSDQTKPRVAIKTAEVDKGGFYVVGLAPAGTHVRIYLNGSALADVTAGVDGQWSLTVGKGVTAGHYVVRADAIDDKGKVTARAEVPFDVPVTVGQAAMPPKPAIRAEAKIASNALPTPDQDAGDNTNPAPDASHAVVAQIDTATVTRGDSLWRISQKELGEGIRYTLIYQANASQIRDPNLIYPGQVFVMPHVN